ncbi:MAG: hypothetical protein QM778_06265 [Myxococcales bacterium]
MKLLSNSTTKHAIGLVRAGVQLWAIFLFASAGCDGGQTIVREHTVIVVVVEKEVGVGGGTIATPKGELSVAVPAGALDSDVKITVGKAEPSVNGSVGQVWEIGPSGTQFKKPVTIALKVDSDKESATKDPKTLAVATVVDDKWVPIADRKLDPQTKGLSGTTKHLSPYALIEVTGPVASTDAGLDAGARPDAGTGNDAGPSVIRCGTLSCGPRSIPGGSLRACCTADSVCGLDGESLPGSPGCVVAAAPGVASDSCGARWDQTDDGFDQGAVDGLFTTQLNGVDGLATLHGCCTYAGRCSADFTRVRVGTSEFDFGYGCPDPIQAGLDPNAGTLGYTDGIPCDPATGEVMAMSDAGVTRDGGVDSGIPTCVPKTCNELNAQCGLVPDGCGGQLNCGACVNPQTCGGGGVPNVCGGF